MIIYQIPRTLRMRTWSQSCRAYKSSKIPIFSEGKVKFFGFFQKSAIWRLFSLTKIATFELL